VVTNLEVSYGIKTGIKHEMLCGLSKMVEEMTQIPTYKFMPLVGEFAFAHQPESHHLGARMNRKAFRAVEPDFVGNRYRIFLVTKAARQSSN